MWSVYRQSCSPQALAKMQALRPAGTRPSRLELAGYQQARLVHRNTNVADVLHYLHVPNLCDSQWEGNPGHPSPDFDQR